MTEFKQTWWNDNINNKLNTFKNWVGDENASTKIYGRKHIYNKNYKSILDIGCAHATMYHGFKNDSYDIDYTGVDSCLFFVNDNNKNGIKTLESDVQNIPVGDSSFDVVFSRHIIEHQSSLEPLLLETIRIAKYEAMHIFFIKPIEGDNHIINHDPVLNLYHNSYSRSVIENILNNSKVSKYYWVLFDNEEVLHIELKFNSKKDYVLKGHPYSLE